MFESKNNQFVGYRIFQVGNVITINFGCSEPMASMIPSSRILSKKGKDLQGLCLP